MRQHQETLEIATGGRGLTDVTAQVGEVVVRAGVAFGSINLFVQHTSASLTIQENADPTARHDLERFLDRLVPDGDALYRHTAEGPDDMPAHVKSALTLTSITVPIAGGLLALGTWQGIYLWEHRVSRHRRRLIAHVVGE